MEDIPLHWADVVVRKVIAEKGDKSAYVCAAGITPSGTVHIGNFREIITVDLVVRAFKRIGKNVQFIYSWDDYDVFRKVPSNMPQQEILKDSLRKPIVDIPDPFGTEESYARHHEVDVEKDVSKVGIKPTYLYQAKKYRALEYVEGIKIALQNAKEIRKILNQYRKEHLSEDWLPLKGYCPTCTLDEVDFSGYDGEYTLTMSCTHCDKNIEVDIREAPFLKLPWRVDWPMRWAHEKVDFEPGGKDHSTEGGSFSTGKEIVNIYNWTAPTYQRYDFVGIKGIGGKISSSKGNVITLRDCLQVYEPAIVRYIFTGTRPNAEFDISFDADVLKIYEDFDKLERIYFGKEKISQKKVAKQKRIYEYSCIVEPPKEFPIQPNFRLLTNLLMVNNMNVDRTVEYFRKEITSAEDEARVKLRATCAKNWIENFAPEDLTFSVQECIDPNLKLSEGTRKAIREVAMLLKNKKNWTYQDLHGQFLAIAKENNVEISEFFKGAYNVLIKKDKGPQLANFVIAIGVSKVAKLFEKV